MSSSSSSRRSPVLSCPLLCSIVYTLLNFTFVVVVVVVVVACCSLLLLVVELLLCRGILIVAVSCVGMESVGRYSTLPYSALQLPYN